MDRIPRHVGQRTGSLDSNGLHVAALHPFVVDEETLLIAQVEIVSAHPLSGR